jgi:hypothetical protein
MPKRHYVPRKQTVYLKWHDNLTTRVTAATPGATAGDVTMLAADNSGLHAKTIAASAAKIASLAASADLRQALAASKTNARGLAGRVKKSTGFTPMLGDELDLFGVENSTDMAAAAPRLNAVVKAAGLVELDFNKKNAEGVRFYGRRGAETLFTYLGSEIHSPYVDARPLLDPAKPETRQYKALFFTGKQEVGLQSGIVTATAIP